MDVQRPITAFYYWKLRAWALEIRHNYNNGYHTNAEKPELYENDWNLTIK